MNYYNKYLKYKNKYFNLKNILGGSLKGDKKKEYIQILHELYEPSEPRKEDKYYSEKLKNILAIAYNESLKIFNEYIVKIAEPEKTILSKNYDIIYKDAIQMIDNNDYNLDIPEFNIRSLQIVILYTELIKNTIEDKTRTNMLNYFQQPSYKIDMEYNLFLSQWTNYKKLFELITKSDGFKDIVYKKSNNYILDMLYKRKSPEILLTYKDITKSRIICYLDYITVKEIIFSYLHEIYYLGINENLDYADGRELTPFEFLHHDITHANNRCVRGCNIKLEKEFYDYLEKEIILPEQKKQIYIIFFLLVHESISEYLMETETTIYDSFNFDNLLPEFIPNLQNWLNPNFYNGLLPVNLREDEKKIKIYLFDSFELFKQKWNEFIKEKEKEKGKEKEKEKDPL